LIDDAPIPVARLRAVAAALEAGEPLGEQLAGLGSWIAQAIHAYVAGQVAPEVSRKERRDDLIRDIAVRFYSGLTANRRAEMIAHDLAFPNHPNWRGPGAGADRAKLVKALIEVKKLGKPLGMSRLRGHVLKDLPGTKPRKSRVKVAFLQKAISGA